MSNQLEKIYYHVGYIAPNRAPLQNSLCFPDISCGSCQWSMCRYPTTYRQARPYFPRYDPSCNCQKYLCKV